MAENNAQANSGDAQPQAQGNQGENGAQQQNAQEQTGQPAQTGQAGQQGQQGQQGDGNGAGQGGNPMMDFLHGLQGGNGNFNFGTGGLFGFGGNQGEQGGNLGSGFGGLGGGGLGGFGLGGNQGDTNGFGTGGLGANGFGYGGIGGNDGSANMDIDNSDGNDSGSGAGGVSAGAGGGSAGGGLSGGGAGGGVPPAGAAVGGGLVGSVAGGGGVDPLAAVNWPSVKLPDLPRYSGEAKGVQFGDWFWKLMSICVSFGISSKIETALLGVGVQFSVGEQKFLSKLYGHMSAVLEGDALGVARSVGRDAISLLRGLNSRFQSQSKVRRFHILKSILFDPPAAGESLESWMVGKQTRMREELRDRLSVDEVLILAVFSLVPLQYQQVLTPLLLKSQCSIEEVKRTVVETERSVLGGESDGHTLYAAAHVKKSGQKKGKGKKGKKGKGKNQHENYKCHGCGAWGHVRKDCPKKKKE